MNTELCEDCKIGELEPRIGKGEAIKLLSAWHDASSDNDEQVTRLADNLSHMELNAVAECLAMRRMKLCQVAITEANQ